ncbi:MAG: hypothetical protein U9R25_17510 [Chloroflexota bacterium]|nr:hypothetical protein [Chloroflexota bacterium]
MTTNDYAASAAQFSREVRLLFDVDEEVLRGPATATAAPDGMPDPLDQLVEHSTALVEETAGYLDAEDPAVQLGAEQHLVAHAAIALQVAERLLDAVEDEEGAPSTAPSRIAPDPVDIEELLSIIESPLDSSAPEPMRTSDGVPPLPAKSDELMATVDQTVDHVMEGVAENSRDSLAGLIGLDVALLKEAADLVSVELGALIEKLGEQTSRLIARAVAFIVQAYDSLLAALGQDVTSDLRRQAADWTERLQEGETVEQLLGYIFDTETTLEEIETMLTLRRFPSTSLGQAQSNVQALQLSFSDRTKLVGQLLAGLGLLKRIPAARNPVVEVASAVVYIALIGLIIYVGADYVDAPRLERIGRVSGILHTVRDSLIAV